MGLETMVLGQIAGTTITGAKALSALSTVMSVFGQIKKGSTESSAAKYNARVNEQNAEIARQQTTADLEKAERDKKIRIGKNIARAGASGTGLMSYSDLIAGNAAEEELDILTIKHAGQLKEIGYTNSASLDRVSAKNAKSSGLIKAGTAALQGYASF